MEPPPLSSHPVAGADFLNYSAAREALKAKIRQEILAEGYTLPHQPESIDCSISDADANAAQPSPATLKAQDIQETLAEKEARNTAHHQSPTTLVGVATDQKLPTKIKSIEPKGRLTTTVGFLTCDLCNTTLTSKAQFDEHISGKKHKANETKAGSGPLSGTKRKAEAVPVGVFDCDLCQVSMNSAEMFDAHRMGKKHKSRESSRGSALGEEGVGILMCGLCGVECNGQPAMDLHLNGKKHKAKPLSGTKRKAEAVPVGVFHCDLCQVSMNSAEMFHAHQKGKKHKARESSRESALGEEGVGVLLCGLCGVECNGQPAMDHHLNGKKHKANVEKLGRLL